MNAIVRPISHLYASTMYAYATIKTLGFIFLVFMLGISFGKIVDALNVHSIDTESSNSQYLYISDTDQLGLDGSSNMTVEAWVRFESLPAFGSDGFDFVSKAQSSGNNRSYVFYFTSTDNTLRWVNQYDGMNGSDVGVSWNPLIGTWYHVVASKSGANVSFYVNGSQVGLTQTGTSTVYNGTAPFRIGAHGNNQSYFDGLIDDVRVWNVARTQEEIVANMHKELAGDEPGLVAYWTFNGGSLEDMTANNNDLTNVNGATFSTDVPFVGEAEINPVIIVPGILGSTQQGNTWVIDPILHTYDDLVATLDENGYTPGEDLFTFGYDWRNSNVETAGLLKQKIDEVKAICGCAQVDLIAHSMGGLVARYYMQSDAYEDDVDQLVFLGTPHRGAPKAYLMWEGGEFVTPSVFDRLTGKFLQGDARRHGYASVFEYLHEHPVAAVNELLPDYSYLFDTGALRAYSAAYPTNAFLESLNAELQVLLDTGSTLYSFVSDSSPTITGLDVVSAPQKAPQWEHGYPENFDDIRTDRGLLFGAGDQTVPLTSASFVNENLEVVNAKHNALPEEAAGEIIEVLRGESATTVVDDWNVPNIRILMFQIFSPANLLITDPAGKKIGALANGTDVNELLGAFYAGPENEREIITIPNPLSGTYTIEVRGTGRGEYTFESSFLADEYEDGISRSGSTAPGQSTVYYVNFAEQDTDALTINATIKGTIADLEYTYAHRLVDRSAYQSIKAKLTSAQFAERMNPRGLRAILENIKKELDRRHGSSVKEEAYDLLMEDVRSLLE